MATTTYTNYAEMLNALRDLAVKAAGVEGANDIGAFQRITRTYMTLAYGEFSNLSEWLDDFADVLQDFLAAEGEELEGWHAA